MSCVLEVSPHLRDLLISIRNVSPRCCFFFFLTESAFLLHSYERCPSVIHQYCSHFINLLREMRKYRHFDVDLIMMKIDKERNEQRNFASNPC